MTTTNVNVNTTFQAETFLGLTKEFTYNTQMGVDVKSSSGKKSHWGWEELTKLESLPVSTENKLKKLTQEFLKPAEWLIMTYWLNASGEVDPYPMEVYINMNNMDVKATIYHPDRN